MESIPDKPDRSKLRPPLSGEQLPEVIIEDWRARGNGRFEFDLSIPAWGIKLRDFSYIRNR